MRVFFIAVSRKPIVKENIFIFGYVFHGKLIVVKILWLLLPNDSYKWVIRRTPPVWYQQQLLLVPNAASWHSSSSPTGGDFETKPSPEKTSCQEALKTTSTDLYSTDLVQIYRYLVQKIWVWWLGKMKVSSWNWIPS